jgi:hypothetical protein
MANDTTPLMLITNVGLAAASTALPEGPYIHIIKFEIGSGYGYTPDVNQTALQGTILYGGDPNPANWAKPTSYMSIGNNTLNIILEIPPEAGPWEFGEVGIFAADSLGNPYLFAIAVFQSPQTKFSSLGTNVVSSYQLNCLLKLQQSTAIFQIDTANGPPAILDIYQWSDVYPPSLSANPDVLMYNVRELSPYGDSTLLVQATDSFWSIDSTYNRYNAGPVGGVQNIAGKYTVVASSKTWVQIAASALHTADLNVGNRGLVLETPDGFFRSVSSVVASGSNYQFNLNTSNDGTYNNSPLPNAPALGSSVTLFRVDRAAASIYYSQIVDPPAAPPLASVGTPGLAYGSSGTYMPTPGVIQAFGMLQTPSANTGRTLTGADDLNNIALASGMYSCNGSGGYPANMPFTAPANIWNHNIGNGTSSSLGTDSTQIAFPWNTAGGDSNGVGGLPPYWRQGHNSGVWTTWQPFYVANKQGAVAGNASAYAKDFNVTITLPKAGTWTIIAWGHAMQNAWYGAQLYINGVLVDTNANFGDQQGIAYGVLTGQTSVSVGGATAIAVSSSYGGLSPGPDVAIQAFAFQTA